MLTNHNLCYIYAPKDLFSTYNVSWNGEAIDASYQKIKIKLK